LSSSSGNIQSYQVETKVDKMTRDKPPAGKYVFFQILLSKTVV